MFHVKTIIALAVLMLSLYMSACAGDVKETDKPAGGEPVVKITAEPPFGTAPLKVAFDASDFLYHYGEKLSFSWDFNDGGKSTGATTSHTFNLRGTYSVALTVDTPFGEKNSWIFIIVN